MLAKPFRFAQYLCQKFRRDTEWYNQYFIQGCLRPHIEHCNKEKRSLKRNLVGYRNWRQKWCKKEGEMVLRKKPKILFSTSFGSVTFTCAKCKIFVTFSSFQTIVPLIFTPSLR